MSKQTTALVLNEDYAPCRRWEIRNGVARSGDAVKNVTSIKRVNKHYYIVDMNAEGPRMMMVSA